MRVGRHCGRTFRARRTRNVCGRQKKKKRRKKTVRRRSRVYIARTPPPLVIILCVRRPQPKRVVCAREFRRAFETELVFPAITLRVKIYARPCSRGGGGAFRRELVSFHETTTTQSAPVAPSIFVRRVCKTNRRHQLSTVRVAGYTHRFPDCFTPRRVFEMFRWLPNYQGRKNRSRTLGSMGSWATSSEPPSGRGLQMNR